MTDPTAPVGGDESPDLPPAVLPVREQPCLLFALGPLRCALPRAAVRELLPMPRLTRPPSLPPALAGFLNLGGEPVPVLALHRLLGVEEPVAEAGGLYRHLVLLHGAPAAALLVDRVLDLMTPPPGSRRPVPEAETLNGCVTALLALPEGMASLLDPDRILLARERASLEALAAAERARLEAWGEA